MKIRLCSLVFVLLGCAAPPVSAEYAWHVYNGHEYALTQSWATWDANEAEAVSVGGHLVTINDEAENTWLANEFAYTYNRDHYGDNMQIGVDIGYYLNPKTQVWEWISGEPVTYERPCVYFPQGGTKAYLHVIPHAYWDLAWNANPLHTEPLAPGDPGYYMKGVIERSLASPEVPELPAPLIAALGGAAAMLVRRVRTR